MKSKKSSLKWFQDFDQIPIFNFHKYSETLDGRYLIRGVDVFSLDEVEKPDEKKAHEIWEGLIDQQIKSFGLSDSIKKRLRHEKKIALMKAKMILNDDFGMKLAITLEESAMKKAAEIENSGTFEELVASVEEFRKVPIDVFKTSAKMFYSYISLIKKRAAKSIKS